MQDDRHDRVLLVIHLISCGRQMQVIALVAVIQCAVDIGLDLAMDGRGIFSGHGADALVLLIIYVRMNGTVQCVMAQEAVKIGGCDIMAFIGQAIDRLGKDGKQCVGAFLMQPVAQLVQRTAGVYLVEKERVGPLQTPAEYRRMQSRSALGSSREYGKRLFAQQIMGHKVRHLHHSFHTISMHSIIQDERTYGKSVCKK